MINIKDHKQMELFDPWAFLSPKRREKLDKDWPGLFQKHLLQELPVSQFKTAFRQGMGRPTKELHTVLGVLLLQQMQDLTDQDAADQLAYNIQWHYALNITEESDSAKYICEKTIWSMRNYIAELGLDSILFDRLTDKLADVFKVNTENQRIDSVHIRSNMRRLGRITIFTKTTIKFLFNLKRQHRALFDSICPELRGLYLDKKGKSAFSLVKPSESEKTLKMVADNLFELVEMFKDESTVCAMHTYKLMQRVLSEHCRINQDANEGELVLLKKPSEIPSDSLQNPSDPDATYSGHKGQGYQVQVMETFCTSEDEKEKAKTLNLVTHVAVQAACESDAQALIPAIADVQVRQVGPKNVLADTLYSSDINHQVAATAGVNLVAPTYKGRTSKLSLSEFTFDEEGCVTDCPAGFKPENCRQNINGKFVAVFNRNQCKSCGQYSICPSKLGVKSAYVRYNPKQQRLAYRRAQEQTDEFIETYRWRAGVEATMSEFDKLTGVKKLRVRGRKAVRYFATMKAAGLNLLRAARVMRARAKGAGTNSPSNGRILFIFKAVKERGLNFFTNSPGICQSISVIPGRYAGNLKLAA
nr:transposase [uncultured Desulfobacter sp.]